MMKAYPFLSLIEDIASVCVKSKARQDKCFIIYFLTNQFNQKKRSHKIAMRKRFFVFSESISSPLRDTLTNKESRHIGMLLCEVRSKEQLSISSNFFVDIKSVCFSISFTNHMTFTFLNIRSTIHLPFSRQFIFCLLSSLVCLFFILALGWTKTFVALQIHNTVNANHCSAMFFSWSDSVPRLELPVLSQLFEDASVLLRLEPTLLEVESPAYIIGDLHGNYEDLMKFARFFGMWYLDVVPAKFIFLGDYVDRGMICIIINFFLSSIFPSFFIFFFLFINI